MLGVYAVGHEQQAEPLGDRVRGGSDAGRATGGKIGAPNVDRLEPGQSHRHARPAKNRSPRDPLTPGCALIVHAYFPVAEFVRIPTRHSMVSEVSRLQLRI